MRLTITAEVALNRLVDVRIVDGTVLPPLGPDADDDTEAVLDWLARLRLLDGVPFEYIVPDAGLLQPETIRFFHLDRNWTDAAVDGALAAGAYGTRDRSELQAAHASIREALDDAERTQFGTTPRSGDTPQITGLLLRSRAVSGWPGLAVRAFRRIGSTDVALQALRIERLSPSVLIALFDDQPTLVQIEEPRQGIQFGVRGDDVVENQWNVPVRDPDDDTVVGPAEVTAPFRTGSAGVLHFTELRKRLANELEVAATDLTSADLAYQLLRLPYQQLFGTPPAGQGPRFDQMLDVTVTIDDIIGFHS